MDISILKRKPELTERIKLCIQPLAPLSMVSDIPGTYYKTQNTPDKYKVCGLFENILGWHFSVNDRDKINKQLKKKDKIREINKSNSSYNSLLFDFFDITLSFTGETLHYNDLWKKSFRRGDAVVHPKGTPNLDYAVLRRKKKWIKSKEAEQVRLKEELEELIKDEDFNKEKIEELKKKILPRSTTPLLLFFKDNIGAYPTYYSSPTLREYISFDGEIQLGLSIDEELLKQLENVLKDCSTGYLGNSEGWVELKIERI
ncbi:MAG: type I-PGING CRISPR-associated protein Cas5p [Bacteroidota bacterium]|uniref:type I-PGING CRISPR-associated protein Cas5p n=1 Tax=Hydrotalea lipotrueae TaxID=2803817 RepID=UPI001C43E8DA|nr:type I-PGING CRISPR-associated protein Cas5p [Hydrotalea lipotrueae]